MSTKKGSPIFGRPKATDGAQLGRLSRSASELSSAGAGGSIVGPGPSSGPPRARSAQAPSRRSGAPLSVLNKTHSFFNTLRSRWHRSRSKERPTRDGSAGSSTEYAADQSSEHSSSATPSTQSPRHRITNNIQDSPLARSGPEQMERPPTPIPAPAHFDILPIMDDMVQKREQQLRQYSFFQLRIHLKRGQNLVAMDKNGQWLTADGSMTTFIATADTQKTPKTHQTHPHDIRNRATHEPVVRNLFNDRQHAYSTKQ